MVSGDLILCAAHSTLQLFSTQLILNQVYYSVGDMNTPWSGLCDNRLTQHWAARLSRICSDQLCNDGSIILLIHVHSIKSYIALIYEKRFGDLHRQSKAQNMLAHVSLKMFPTLVDAYLLAPSGALIAIPTY